jgi:hypothetical protein
VVVVVKLFEILEILEMFLFWVVFWAFFWAFFWLFFDVVARDFGVLR